MIPAPEILLIEPWTEFMIEIVTDFSDRAMLVLKNSD